MNEFLNFNKMMTPTIIKIIFIASCVLSIIIGIGMMFSGMANEYGGGGLTVFMGLVIAVAGPFISRIYCEILIVLFKMHENLHILTKQTQNGTSPVPPTTPTRSANSQDTSL